MHYNRLRDNAVYPCLYHKTRIHDIVIIQCSNERDRIFPLGHVCGGKVTRQIRGPRERIASHEQDKYRPWVVGALEFYPAAYAAEGFQGVRRRCSRIMLDYDNRVLERGNGVKSSKDVIGSGVEILDVITVV